MQRIKITIKPLTPLATPLRGDTLFGQLCWAAKHLLGDEKLTQLLNGYTTGSPWLVVSDAFPAGFLPRPQMPAELLGFDSDNSGSRKAAKKMNWLPDKQASALLSQWHQHLINEEQVAAELQITKGSPLTTSAEQYHNTINRLTGTTGSGEFSPYSVRQIYLHPDLRFDLYFCFDSQQVDQQQVVTLLEYVANSGYGKDASTGAGKFCIETVTTLPEPVGTHCWLTLAPAVIRSGLLNSEQTFYSLFTRFGRHGAELAVMGKPFKNPVQMADTAALLTFSEKQKLSFFGQGCGGNGELSKQLAATVHQGYAPVIAINKE